MKLFSRKGKLKKLKDKNEDISQIIKAYKELKMEYEENIVRWKKLIKDGIVDYDYPEDDKIVNELKERRLESASKMILSFHNEIDRLETVKKEISHLKKRFSKNKSKWNNLVETGFLDDNYSKEDIIEGYLSTFDVEKSQEQIDRMEESITSSELLFNRFLKQNNDFINLKKKWDHLLEVGYIKDNYKGIRKIESLISEKQVDEIDSMLGKLEDAIEKHETGLKKKNGLQSKYNEVIRNKEKLIEKGILPDIFDMIENDIHESLEDHKFKKSRSLIEEFQKDIEAYRIGYEEAMEKRNDIDAYAARIEEKISVSMPSDYEKALSKIAEYEYNEAIENFIKAKLDLKRQEVETQVILNTEMEMRNPIIKKGRWESGILRITNNGNLHIEDIQVSSSSDNFTLDIDDTIESLKGGETDEIALRLRVLEEGDVPIRYTIHYKLKHTAEERSIRKKVILDTISQIEKKVHQSIYEDSEDDLSNFDTEDMDKTQQYEKRSRTREKIDEIQIQHGDFSSYRKVKKIGAGGFSTVFKVSKKGEHFAMKVPKDVDMDGENTIEISESLQKKYRTESSIWAGLTRSYPEGVVRLLDIGTSPFPWFVMEYCEISLRDHMVDIDLIERLKIASDLLRKLDKIHHYAVNHLDIKPENILLKNGNPKFTDFGISKVVRFSSASSMNNAGTFFYRAPEQIAKKQFGGTDWRTDIWQMGVIIFEMITETYPFDTEDPYNFSFSVLHDRPKLPSDVNSKLSEFDGLFLKAFKLDKEKRWQSASEMKVALDNVMMKLSVWDL